MQCPCHLQAFPDPLRAVQMAVTFIAALAGGLVSVWKSHITSTQAATTAATTASASAAAAASGSLDSATVAAVDAAASSGGWASGLGALPVVLLAVSGVLLTRALQLWLTMRTSTKPLLLGMKAMRGKAQVARQVCVDLSSQQAPCRALYGIGCVCMCTYGGS
jgi:hypothetical protein